MWCGDRKIQLTKQWGKFAVYKMLWIRGHESNTPWKEEEEVKEGFIEESVLCMEWTISQFVRQWKQEGSLNKGNPYAEAWDVGVYVLFGDYILFDLEHRLPVKQW